MKLIHSGERAEGVFAKEEAHPLAGKTTNAILRQPQPARAPYRLGREPVFFGNAQELGGLQVIVGHPHLDALVRQADGFAPLKEGGEFCPGREARVRWRSACSATPISRRRSR